MTESKMSLPELEAARAELDAKIAAAKLAAKSDSIARVKALMAELGVTQRMLGKPWPDGRRPAKSRDAKASTKGAKLPAKYRDPATGAEWSGHGLRPNWLRDAIKDGYALESFAV